MFHVTDWNDFLFGGAVGMLLFGLIKRRDPRPAFARLAKWMLIAGFALLIVAISMGAPSFIAGWKAAGRR